MDTSAPQRPALSTAGLVLIGALACAGAGLSLYLALVSGRPVGCGAGSGCEQVLSSRWAGVGPVPVGVLGAGAYIVLLACLVGMRVGARSAGWLGAAVGVAILGAAVWFVALQLAVIHAVCPYCMAEHGIGIVTALLLMAAVARSVAGRRLVGPTAVGLLGAVLLIGAQAAFPHHSTLARLDAHGNFDTGVGASRTVGVLDGTLSLDPRRELLMGSPDAKHVIVGLFDYACPHCRRTHGYLAEAVRRWPSDLAVIELPCPLNASCNPHVPETEPRFVDSCDLALLALAVHQAAPDKLPAFDAWLFEPETPRTLKEARAEAERLVGAQGVAAAGTRSLSQIIARNTTAFGRSGADRLPIILSPEIGGIAGRPESQDQLFELLIKELGLPAAGG